VTTRSPGAARHSAATLALLALLALLAVLAILALFALLAPAAARSDPARPPGPPPAAGEDELWRVAAPIDVHAHIGSFAGYDLTLATLLSEMTRFHVELALVSNVDGAALPGTTADLPEREANSRTLEVVRAHPRLRGLAWARPGDPDGSPANLEPYLRDHGFVGVKLHPVFNRFEADSARAAAYVELCERYRVPVVIHCGAVDPIVRLARRFPGVPVVLYHAGFGTDHQEAIGAVERSARARDARLYLETSQVEAPAAAEMVRRAGASRVLFGTDATYYGKGHYRRYTPVLRLLGRTLGAGELALVLRENARRLFPLEPRGRGPPSPSAPPLPPAR
jgi:predicted TIM-barrel fold metal-dependent hydrolase